MKTYIKAAVLIGALLLWGGFSFYRLARTFAQNQPAEPYLSANQQKGEFPSNVNLECTGCHGPGKTLPNLGGEKFHKDAHGALDQSIHAKIGANGQPAASCRDCHTINGDMTTVLPAENPKSTVNRANMVQTCGRCHQDAARTFKFSIHGSKRQSGETKAATCADCHGSHSIFPAKDIRSMVFRTNTAEEACVKCHSDKVADWETSSHGKALREGSEKAPTCTTCHIAVSHAPMTMTIRDFNLHMVENCSKCHEKQAPSYRDTFHGQATHLNLKLAATCADCHTPHHNLPASDPQSSVNPKNLIQTCAQCHTNANANFVTYDPHPEPNDPAKSALVYYVAGFMKWLLLGVFGFFGIHTALWLQRSITAYISERHHESPDDDQWVVRFAPIHRLTHVLIVISFILLAATGLPLMFHYTEWAQRLGGIPGGIMVARATHRVCAVITFTYALIHLFFVVRTAVIERKYSILYGPDSMTIRKQDFIDVFNMVRWFLYLGPRPKLDRWTYWEKFDYFAVFWGIPVIGLSGLMLWFPNFFTAFLPGVVLNLAMIIHSEEALLATAFIFAFHFFHNHLRPENFPMDISIFTGRIRLSRFKEERAAEYERLVNEGQLDTVLTDPPSPRARLISTIFGFTAYIAGLIMVVLLFITFIKYTH